MFNIRKTVLDLGTRFDRLLIVEIMEVSGVQNEDLIIKIVLDMIKNKEIYAEYFSSTKSVAFNLQANIDEIDKLMKKYEEWEKKSLKKKYSNYQTNSTII